MFKQNAANIRAEMRDMRDESEHIEMQMERRLKSIINQAQLQQYIPQATSMASSLQNTRQEVEKRLGGPFDYDSLLFELQDIVGERDEIDRQLRNFNADRFPEAQLIAGATIGKVEFDFRPPTKPSKAMQQLRVQKQRAQVDIRREKPGWLRDLETYPEEWSGPKLVDDEAPRRTFLQTEESEE